VLRLPRYLTHWRPHSQISQTAPSPHIKKIVLHTPSLILHPTRAPASSWQRRTPGSSARPTRCCPAPASTRTRCYASDCLSPAVLLPAIHPTDCRLQTHRTDFSTWAKNAAGTLSKCGCFSARGTQRFAYLKKSFDLGGEVFVVRILVGQLRDERLQRILELAGHLPLL
jgi:hypothetical protein